MTHLNIEQFATLWARQLHSEFEDICWKYNLKLLPPVFEISKSERQLGSWHQDTRTIRISSFLIVNYSWSVTINVLKHEIAHQICSEIFNSKEVAHGKAFNQACAFLGLPEEYRKARGDLPEDVGFAVSGTQPTLKGRSFIDKVEKLLALAKSSNENEAALAMQKANELIEKYNIMQLDSEQDVSYTYAIINKKMKRIESYQRQICAILRDFFYVKIVTSYLYDPLSNQTHKTIEILGTNENVAIAEYCYHFLENRLSALWSQVKHRYNGKTRTEKNSYYLGLLNGFYDKLNRQKKKPQHNKSSAWTSKNCQKHDEIYSLVVAEDEKLTEYVGMRFPRLRTLSRRGPRIYKSTYDEGLETGKKITFNKGVTQKEGNIGNLLT